MAARSSTVDVRAPAEVKVYLDGKIVGNGTFNGEIAAGTHRISVILGEPTTGEEFRLEPGGTYRYELTDQ